MADFTVVSIDKDGVDYKRLVDLFASKYLTVTDVLRINNPTVEAAFEFQREQLGKKRRDINMQRLLHATKGEIEAVLDQGLDQRLANNGFFGRGIYFSEDPSKCDSYIHAGVTSRRMLECDVLLGQVKVYPDGESARDLKREPSVEFDSVEGFIKTAREKVVYKGERVLPLHIIYYSRQSATPAPAAPLIFGLGTNMTSPPTGPPPVVVIAAAPAAAAAWNPFPSASAGRSSSWVAGSNAAPVPFAQPAARSASVPGPPAAPAVRPAISIDTSAPAGTWGHTLPSWNPWGGVATAAFAGAGAPVHAAAPFGFLKSPTAAAAGAGAFQAGPPLPTPPTPSDDYEAAFALAADFVRHYFEANGDVGRLYANDACMSFDGEKVGGVDAIMHHIQSNPFPGCVRCTSLDVQPTNDGPFSSLLIFCMGYSESQGPGGAAQQAPFQRTFILGSPDGANYFITHDVFRRSFVGFRGLFG